MPKKIFLKVSFDIEEWTLNGKLLIMEQLQHDLSPIHDYPYIW